MGMRVGEDCEERGKEKDDGKADGNAQLWEEKNFSPLTASSFVKWKVRSSTLTWHPLQSRNTSWDGR